MEGEFLSMVESMQPILNTIDQLFTAGLGWVGQVVGVVTSKPLLLMFSVISLVGLGIGLFHRLKG